MFEYIERGDIMNQALCQCQRQGGQGQCQCLGLLLGLMLDFVRVSNADWLNLQFKHKRTTLFDRPEKTTLEISRNKQYSIQVDIHHDFLT